MRNHVVFDDRPIGRNVDDAIATNVVENVVANRHAEAGVPFRAYPVSRPAENAAAIHVPDAIIFYAKVNEATGLAISERTVVDAAVDLFLLGAVDVMNSQVLNINVVQFAYIFRDNVHASTNPCSFTGICNLKVTNFPVLLILE